MIKKYPLNKGEAESLLSITEHVINDVSDTDIEQIISFLREKKLAHFKNLSELRKHLLNVHDKPYDALQITQLPEHHNSTVLTLVLASLSPDRIVKEYDHGTWIKKVESSLDLKNNMDRPSSKDCKNFYLHTDLSYTECPPLGFMFHCLENNPSLGGETILCSLETILTKVSEKSLVELQKNQFAFPAPSYYGKIETVIHSILQKDYNHTFNIRYRRDDLYALTKAGANAISELTSIINDNYYSITQPINSALFINNNKYLHGRQGYIVKTEKQRVFNQIYFKPTQLIQRNSNGKIS